MKYTLILLIFIAKISFATTECIIFIGDGSYLKPELEKRFVTNLKKIHKKWGSECDVKYNLVNLGKETYVYDGIKYKKLEGFDINGAASKQNLMDALNKSFSRLKSGDKVKLYLGDHGGKDGASAIDGLITPAFLEKKIKQMSSYGIEFDAIFNHCYSGQMLEALYDFEEKKMYGCGFSIANDDVGYTDKSFITTNRSMSRQSEINNIYASKNSFASLANQNTLTSDRFLVEYAESKFEPGDEKSCYIGNIYNILGVNTKMIKSMAHPQVKKIIEHFAKQNKLLKNNYPIVLRSISLAKINSNTELRERINTVRYKTNKSFRTLVLEETMKSPDDLTFYTNHRKLYKSIQECTNTGVLVWKCEKYNEYIRSSQRWRKYKSELKKVINVKDLGVKLKSSKWDNYTINDFEKFLRKESNKQNIANIHQARQKILSKKIYALTYMMKNDDIAAIDFFKKMRRCEGKKI